MHHTQADSFNHDIPAALARLCEGMAETAISEGRFESVAAEKIPAPFQQLLVHENHMTAVLGQYYACPLELRVLDELRQEDDYRRRIVLTLADTDDVVEFGVVHLNLKTMPHPVRREILDRRKPLGEILITHDVMRRIDPKVFLHLPKGYCLPRLFRGGNTEAYGRMGTIHCDGRPAVELLEIVTGFPKDNQSRERQQPGAGNGNTC